MNDKKVTYWKWKSTIIDFDNIKDEKADFGDYLTKKEMIFSYLGCPDDDIHEWYNGGWSCEYNYALSYAKEYGLVEDYIDYEDKIYNLQTRWNSLREINEEAREYLTSYEAISTIQGLDNIENNKQLDEKTMNEMTNRYLKVHDKLLSILDKMNELEGKDNK